MEGKNSFCNFRPFECHFQKGYLKEEIIVYISRNKSLSFLRFSGTVWENRFWFNRDTLSNDK